MSIRLKLLLTGIVMAVLVAGICIIGYITAERALTTSISGEINAVLTNECSQLDGYLREKGKLADATANLLEEFVDRPERLDHALVSLGSNDPEVFDIVNGTEDNHFIGWVGGDASDRVNPHDRPWYQQAVKTSGLSFTAPYEDITQKKMIVSATRSYSDRTGALRGGVCVDISLDTLGERVKSLKYHGEGEGVIVSSDGLIIASSEGYAMKRAEDTSVLKAHFAEMIQKKSGYFSMEKNGEEQIIAYGTVPSTGWIVAIAVPKSVAFAQLESLKMTYGVLSVVGILLVIGIIIVLLRFAATITRATEALTGHVDALAHGQLNLPDLPVNSDDELGRLAANFNTMVGNIRSLIRQVASTAEQLAASSEELTAGAHQMAESATEIAGTVSATATGSEKQLHALTAARDTIHKVSDDIGAMSAKSDAVADESAATADAAKKGASLMNDAMDKMTAIEQSVQRSAEVVEKLGESSQQIGEIVETISAIAEQTNLLALNAAIEAARAGETGRGFAVVAEEVRKLAEQSRDAADQIKERITSVQSDTTHAVNAMHTGTEEVQVGAGAIHAVGEQFDSIMHKVNAINTEMAAINAAMQNVAQGAEEIVHAAGEADAISQTTAAHMQTIASASESQSASSEEIAAASQALATLATDLQNTTQKFRF